MRNRENGLPIHSFTLPPSYSPTLSPFMSLNLVLIQIVAFTCFFLLLQFRRLPRGWLVVSLSILVVLAITYVVVPNQAGLISGSLWFVLILLPLLGYAKINQWVLQERYRQARRMAIVVGWLHPADGFVEYPQLLKGLELGKQGKFDQAEKIFSKYQTANTPTGRNTTVMMYRMGARWHELIEWIQAKIPEQVLYKEPFLAVAYVRSLGEVGDLAGLLREVEQFERRAAKTTNPLLLNTMRMYALAFCGLVSPVQTLLDGSLRAYSQETRQFWQATAELMAGNEAIAREWLSSLNDSQDASLRNAIQWRLSQPRMEPFPLIETSYPVLTQIQTAIQQEARYSHRSIPRTRRSYATYALIGLNLTMFAAETVLGGNDDLLVLYQLGALVPELVFTGQWWRSLTAIFLHAGWIHLLANMLGLYVFGSLVEAILGRTKFLVCYFISGIGSMLVVATLAVLLSFTDQITVGASGAILGLVGAEAAIQLKGWRLEKAAIAGERLRLILFVVVLQTVSDLLTPQVSLVGHVSGLILGFLTGLVLFKAKKLTQRS